MNFKKQLWALATIRFSQMYLEALCSGNTDQEEVAEVMLKDLGAWESFTKNIGHYLSGHELTEESVSPPKEGKWHFASNCCPSCDTSLRKWRKKVKREGRYWNYWRNCWAYVPKQKTLRTHRTGR